MSYPHPYRTNAAPSRAKAPSRVAWDLAVPFGILWALCVAQVCSVVSGGASFSGGDTVALLMLVLLPWLLFRAR